MKNLATTLSLSLALTLAIASLSASEPGSDKKIKPRGAAPGVVLQVNGGNGFVGGTVDYQVVAMGLPSGATPALGAYDLQLGFDPLQLAFQSISFADSLGDEGLGEAFSLSADGAGTVDAATVSLLVPATLVTQQQGDPIPLFTVTFQALAAGTLPVSLALNAPAGDQNGDPLASQQVGGEANVSAEAPVTQIPTLSQWGLILFSALLMGAGLKLMQRIRSRAEEVR
ncbi:MAG TPA: IPTL-CTERM sorting domain-containing protein [Acidobacteriota bacterium]|nr:IPTL-CTERM sorting domain-containing protein [Acidobacteriota bacterium]